MRFFSIATKTTAYSVIMGAFALAGYSMEVNRQKKIEVELKEKYPNARVEWQPYALAGTFSSEARIIDKQTNHEIARLR